MVVTLPVVPDERRARHLRAVMRRIHQVKLAVTASSRVSCTVDAVGHRLPLTRRIPITTALGLGLLGVPLVLSVADS